MPDVIAAARRALKIVSAAVDCALPMAAADRARAAHQTSADSSAAAVDAPAGDADPQPPAGAPLTATDIDRIGQWVRAMVRSQRSNTDIVHGFQRLLHTAQHRK